MATQYTINTKFAAVDGMTAVLGRMQAKVAGFRKKHIINASYYRKYASRNG